MLLIKDTSVVIHLAKTTLLETSCNYFGNVHIPQLVIEEIRKQESEDREIIEELIKKKRIVVSSVKNKLWLKKAYQFNIQGGEAETLALYWETKADLLATDDYNVRKKKNILKIEMIGTPGIMMKLYKEKMIRREKYNEAIQKLKKIGWFSNTILDKLTMEAEKNG